jgi:hypothetical protein
MALMKISGGWEVDMDGESIPGRIYHRHKSEWSTTDKEPRDLTHIAYVAIDGKCRWCGEEPPGLVKWVSISKKVAKCR